MKLIIKNLILKLINKFRNLDKLKLEKYQSSLPQINLKECLKYLDVYKSDKNIQSTLKFVEDGIYQLEFISKILSKHIPSQTGSLKILDYGCGGGQLGIACLINNNACEDKVSYCGLDVTKKRIDYLNKNIGSLRDDIKFYHVEASGLIDYIGVRDKDEKNSSFQTLFKEATMLPKFDENYKIQFSSSVFTHMTPAHIIQRLNEFKSHGIEIFINSWFLVNGLKLQLNQKINLLNKKRKFSRYSDFDGYCCYIEDPANVLFTIGYSYESMLEIYKKAGLEILEIIPGKWGNLNTKDCAKYQDWVIAKIKK